MHGSASVLYCDGVLSVRTVTGHSKGEGCCSAKATGDMG